MEGNCRNCMRREEEIYWNQFQTHHFSHLLLPDFHSRLVSPSLLVSQAGFEQDERINSDIITEAGQLPVTSPTSGGKYPLSVSKKKRGEISNNNLDPKAASSRTSVSETCKRKALSLAKSAVSANGFLVAMKRSHVLTKCFLTIPIKWSAKNMSHEPQEVVMQMNQRKWHMKFSSYRSPDRGGITTGWKKFVRDNHLCLGDVCVFEPAKPETKPLHIYVYIFRAAETESSSNNG
ncbi:hypothetical protein EUTSA_v10027291mg, partial [Eutrema salsugineum]